MQLIDVRASGRSSKRLVVQERNHRTQMFQSHLDCTRQATNPSKASGPRFSTASALSALTVLPAHGGTSVHIWKWASEGRRPGREGGREGLGSKQISMYGCTDGWMDGWMDGRTMTGGRAGGRADGRTDGRMCFAMCAYASTSCYISIRT